MLKYSMIVAALIFFKCFIFSKLTSRNTKPEEMNNLCSLFWKINSVILNIILRYSVFISRCCLINWAKLMKIYDFSKFSTNSGTLTKLFNNFIHFSNTFSFDDCVLAISSMQSRILLSKACFRLSSIINNFSRESSPD